MSTDLEKLKESMGVTTLSSISPQKNVSEETGILETPNNVEEIKRDINDYVKNNINNYKKFGIEKEEIDDILDYQELITEPHYISRENYSVLEVDDVIDSIRRLKRKPWDTFIDY